MGAASLTMSLLDPFKPKRQVQRVSDVILERAAAEADDLRRVSFDVPGGTMAGIAFGARTPTPDIVFLHATGFNARAYRSILAPLGEKYHVLALDARGHGRTTLRARTFGYTSWHRHSKDLIALMQRHFTQPVVLAGHSMGGTVSLLTAGKRPDLVSGLALFDPVIMPAWYYMLFELPFVPSIATSFLPIARKTLDRRRRFPSREAAVQALTGRGVFKPFTQEMIADYVGDGFFDLPKKDGVKIACHPKYEAACYCAQRNHPWTALRCGSGPLVVLRAEKHAMISQAAAQRMAQIRPEARIATVEGAGHMLPMERPDRVRAALESVVLMAGRRFEDVE